MGRHLFYFFGLILLVLSSEIYCTNAVASGESSPVSLQSTSDYYSWIDSDGQRHYADHSEDTSRSYQAEFLASASVHNASKQAGVRLSTAQGEPHRLTKKSAGTVSKKRTSVLPVDCQLIQSRINTLQRLMATQSDPQKSAFAPEYAQRKQQWLREQCEKGGVFPHRELTESRKASRRQ